VEEAVIGYSISYRKEIEETVIRDYGRSIQFGLRNWIKEFFFTVGLLLLGLVPLLGYVTAPFIFIIQAMYVGFSTMDFTLGRYFSINGSIDFIRKNLGFSLGNGIAFMLIIMIPVVGLFFAPTLGTAAATLKAVPRVYRPSIA
jgi:CysZ protein